MTKEETKDDLKVVKFNRMAQVFRGLGSCAIILLTLTLAPAVANFGISGVPGVFNVIGAIVVLVLGFVLAFKLVLDIFAAVGKFHDQVDEF